MRRTNTVLASAAALLTATQATAQATEWFVYTSAGARELSTQTRQNDAECNGPDDGICSAASGFVGEHSNTLTRASSLADVSGTDPGFYGISAASAFTSADLATGELKLRQSALGNSRNENTSSGGQASLRDFLTFDLSGYAAPVSITVDLSVHGEFEGAVQPRFVFSISDITKSLSTGTVGWADGNPDGPSTTTNAVFIDFGHSMGSGGNWSIYGPDRFVGTFLLDPAHPVVSLDMALTAGGSTEYGNTFTHFENTASVKFLLPTGLTYTSASGAFLTASPTVAVPEPATWAMMIVGFGALGGAARRRRSFARV